MPSLTIPPPSSFSLSLTSIFSSLFPPNHQAHSLHAVMPLTQSLPTIIPALRHQTNSDLHHFRYHYHYQQISLYLPRLRSMILIYLFICLLLIISVGVLYGFIRIIATNGLFLFCCRINRNPRIFSVLVA